jgi:hypothetical protein
MKSNVRIATASGWLERLVGGKGWRNHEHGRQKKRETVRPKRLALLQAGSMAVAVLTPRNNDLESGIWTRAAPLTRLRISAQCSREKKKKANFCL